MIHWNDPHFVGKHNEWDWLVVRNTIRNLDSLVIAHHIGKVLCITAFDSSSITATPQEQAIGWRMKDGVMISPPLTPQLCIPRDEYDEWYIYESIPDSISVDDQFVNYGGFNLVDPQQLAASQDPTWDRHNYDWLISFQARFWANIDRLRPLTYVASGDVDVIVTRTAEFASFARNVTREDVS